MWGHWISTLPSAPKIPNRPHDSPEITQPSYSWDTELEALLPTLLTHLFQNPWTVTLRGSGAKRGSGWGPGWSVPHRFRRAGWNLCCPGPRVDTAGLTHRPQGLRHRLLGDLISKRTPASVTAGVGWDGQDCRAW